MPTNKRITIRIIWPSSLESRVSIHEQISRTKRLFNLEIRHDPFKTDINLSKLNTILLARAKADTLTQALIEPDTDAVLCARGGYGASDLLPLIPWQQLKNSKPKLIVGYSDISSLHSAVFTILGWPSIHGPMPATEYWDLNGNNEDLKELFNLIGSRRRKGTCELEFLGKNSPPSSLEGWLFGGCFSVLTNLIGTPYFPKSLSKAIVFIEDVGETDLKLGRYLNQWIQSGSLSGVSAIILGTFKGLHTESAEAEKIQSEIWSSLSERLQETGVPIFGTHHFGHQTSNYPLMLGANGSIANSRLNWEQVTEEGVS